MTKRQRDCIFPQEYYISEDLQGVFNKDVIKIVSWNVNGLRSQLKKIEFQSFLNKNIDILCLNETKIPEKLIERITPQFPQFPFQYYSCCQKSKGQSGVAILSKVQPIEINYNFGSQKDTQGRILTAEYKTFIVVAIYAPYCNQQRIDDGSRVIWDIQFFQHIEALESKGKAIVIIGDLNLIQTGLDKHGLKDDFTIAVFPIGQAWIEFISERYPDTFRLQNPTLREYSYFCQRQKANREKNVGWRLDFALLSRQHLERLLYSKILQKYRISDHQPILLAILKDNQ